MDQRQRSDAPLARRDESPATLETQVIRLREDCRRVLEELERRVERLVQLPARVKSRIERLPRLLARAIERHPYASLGILAAVAAGAGLALSRPRRRRAIFRA